MEFIEIGNELYQVIRVIKESNNPIIETWRVHLMADKVFRRDGYYFFCRIIDDAIIEDI